MKQRLLPLLLLLVCAGCAGPEENVVSTFPLDDITLTPSSPLAIRVERSLDRLESEIYQPDRAIADDENWPGDYVGRALLGATMDARAMHAEPRYVGEILRRLPGRMNAKGYIGGDFAPDINEQQFSGHGWLLRGLCEYYKWKGDETVLPMIRTIVDSLFMPGAGRFAAYPIDPSEHSNAGGEASGSINSASSGWILSTDVGCLFIGMAGLVDAYEVLRDEALAPVIEEMLGRFLEIDLVGIQMQTHATLSALRGMLKYYSLSGEARWLDAARERWATYEREGMTCTYSNYNWFGRFDTWTEPCAIVDSYIVAFELWKATLDPHYRDMAELICCNGLAHGQRDNGGFGCDSCPSEEDPFLRVIIPEATWCCTMRGGEGLPRVSESSWARRGDRLYVPFYRANELSADGLSILEETDYPSEASATFVFARNDAKIAELLLPDLPWAEQMTVSLNGTPVEAVPEDGFLAVRHAFQAGDRVEVA
ncbi:MAG: glycoside hydrolase family 127 protein, partial [Bacteroidales bacterium]|nr:glycoside hydrolase family 127 protein [Bacteroidales bacterium]